MITTIVDVIVDCQLGDCGKGKIANSLLISGNYTHSLKANGSGNSGRSLYLNNVKYIARNIPCGVYHGVKSIIGSGAVLNVANFFQEIREIEEKNGYCSRGSYTISDIIKVAYNAHIITETHKNEDEQDTKIGSTRQGNMPAYRAKYGRTGVRAENVPALQRFLIDPIEEFHRKDRDTRILCEVVQGFGLDIDYCDDYPYCTSSHCTVAAVLQNGLSWKNIKQVIGVAKGYLTYVGNKSLGNLESDPILAKIREVGHEFGSVTGRPRHVMWNDMRQLRRAIQVNGVTTLIFNKMDVLQEVGVWKVRNEFDKIVQFSSEDDYKDYLQQFAQSLGVTNVKFSYSPYTI